MSTPSLSAEHCGSSPALRSYSVTAAEQYAQNNWKTLPNGNASKDLETLNSLALPIGWTPTNNSWVRIQTRTSEPMAVDPSFALRHCWLGSYSNRNDSGSSVLVRYVESFHGRTFDDLNPRQQVELWLQSANKRERPGDQFDFYRWPAPGISATKVIDMVIFNGGLDARRSMQLRRSIRKRRR